jgi:glyoxylate reductase
VNVGGRRAREIGIDDGYRPFHPGEGGGNGGSLPTGLVGDARLADFATRGFDVGEHRDRERTPRFGGRLQTRLALNSRKRDHDRDHSGKPMQAGDTDGVRIAATQTFPGPAWGELEVELLDGWPPAAPLPGVDVLALAVTRVGAAELELFPDLRLVANYGVGYDLVDVEECRRRGIAVTNTPGVLDAAVADFALALILATRRNVVAADGWIREGGWQNNWARPRLLGRDLAGARLGLVGFGRIGREVARRAEVFGLEVVFHTRTSGIGLDELLASSDVVSLHVPLTEETRGLISRERLGQMQDGATLINTARGAVVDEKALVDELVSGRISAGLDVFAAEPNVPERLFGLPNVVLTPHIASATAETRAAMTRVLVDNVVAYSRGEPLITAI